jgi:hypothetical protein
MNASGYREVFDFSHANMTLRVDDTTNMILVASDGVVTVHGGTQDRGIFTFLDAPVNSGIHTRLPTSPGVVTWAWARGSPFAGHFDDYEVWINRFPAWTQPRVGVQGAVQLQIEGGNLSFQDNAGVNQSLQTGSWTEAPGSFGAPPGSVVYTFRRVLFDGTVGSADLPVAESWGVSGPSARWLVQGRASWADASGWVGSRGGIRSFQHANVTAQGAFTLDASRAGASELSGAPWSYSGNGQFSSVWIDGEQVSGFGLAREAVAGAAAAAVAFVVGWFLFTRLVPARLLDHPKRRRIVEVAVAEPGIHLKELARRVGGGWGMFRAHIATLRKAGILRTEHQGR